MTTSSIQSSTDDVHTRKSKTWFNICFLDARHFKFLPDIITQITQVKAAAGDEAVLFLLNYPGKQLLLWRSVLIRAFCQKTHYNNVVQYYVDGIDGQSSVGQAAIYFGQTTGNARLSHVQFVPAPPAHGCAVFGTSMPYVELRFHKHPGANARTVGIVWVPDLFCSGKAWFNDSNYWGAVEMIAAALACERHVTMFENEPVYPSIREAMQSVRTHLDGFLVITDMRSRHLGDGMPIHQWNMSGQMHAVQGSFASGEFIDTCATEQIGFVPVCYRIRHRSSQYHVMNHSFDFWSEAFSKYKAQVPVGFVLHSIHEEPEWEVTSIGNSAVAASSSSTENVDSRLGTTASGEWKSESATATESECMVCLSRPPTMLFKACGHCGLCGHCWKWMCKEQFNKNKSGKCQVSPASLKTKIIEKVAIKCPVCRQVTQVVHYSKYTHSVYWV